MRKLIAIASAVLCTCIGNTLLAQTSFTKADVAAAEKILGLRFTEKERDSMMNFLVDQQRVYNFLRSQQIPNHINSANYFTVKNNQKRSNGKSLFIIPINVALPKNKEALAYYSIPQLASLIYNKKISSLSLTQLFIKRLKEANEVLHCAITITEEAAYVQAKKADAELATGKYRGILHGIPYGIKDLFTVKNTKTTWGAMPYAEQQIQQDAVVAERLRDAGAILIAKLSLGELAMDDTWFGGRTRNPWDTSKGSGGSSAGSAAATAAGLVPFAIGTETWGSIVDPSMRCGTTGLRPTYGAVPKTGAMNLAFSSDKVGPICRSAEDAAIVFAAIKGYDAGDLSSQNSQFSYKPLSSMKGLKIAYIQNYIDTLPNNCPEKRYLAELKKMGANITPIIFSDSLHANDVLSLIVSAESAAFFEELTLTDKDDLLAQQHSYNWPNIFRSGQMIPATAYINACRMRTMIIEKMAPLLNDYDIIIAPPSTGEQLAITNLTGHPSLTFPIGFTKSGLPSTISIIGKHFEEATLVAFAQFYQSKTSHHKQMPPMFAVK
ncbi:MAG: amidase [Chitinophagaceae bacterium]